MLAVGAGSVEIINALLEHGAGAGVNNIDVVSVVAWPMAITTMVVAGS
jgi:uracil phosphoribosyltransferase